MVSRPTRSSRLPLKTTSVDPREQPCSQQQLVFVLQSQPQTQMPVSQAGTSPCTCTRKHGVVSASSDTTCRTSAVPQMFCPNRAKKVSQPNSVVQTIQTTQSTSATRVDTQVSLREPTQAAATHSPSTRSSRSASLTISCPSTSLNPGESSVAVP